MPQTPPTPDMSSAQAPAIAQRVPQRTWWGALAVAMLAAAGLVLASFFIASKSAREDQRANGARQLQIIALDLEAVLERYETLPYALTHLPLVSQLLNAPQDTATLDQLHAVLKDLQQQARVNAIFLMDTQGKALASSNWDTSQTYVGQNFSFRPYFRDSMQGRPGFYYAIGHTTGIPGYFISQPVYAPGSQRAGAPIGVIAVKITLDAFEQAWHGMLDPIALADRHGVVFLSNRAAWRYHSLRALDPAEKAGIEQTLQYVRQDIGPLASLPNDQREGFGEYMAQSVGRLGWELMLFPSQAKNTRAALQASAVTVLLLVVASALGALVYQRRRRLEERRAAQLALNQAADELEHRIAQRTTDLQSANAQLASNYEQLQQAETLLRSTQNEMVQAGKLAMLGQMAAGITHELNQPLTAIRAFADNAATFLSRGNVEQTRENLQHIGAASARMGSLLGQLKIFARKSPLAVSTVEVNQAIKDAALLLHSEFERQGVQLELDLPAAAYVLGDTVRVEQVLINLLRNALDAVEQAPVKRVQVLQHSSKDCVVIRIVDSGSGLADGVLEHLFEPFFTTKASGRGLGLGLAISSSIVQAMNGRLQAHNHAGGGAEFVVTLPAHTQESP